MQPDVGFPDGLRHSWRKTVIVECEKCHTKYRIPDEKVRGKGVKVRCAKCHHTFTV
ncbi:MAG: zinc-ribbon domain-containing protein, partial [Proteobacteria bacterium]|nr:zinc-ribbon domain-containing protein [Pseudomonadota bacterium]